VTVWCAWNDWGGLICEADNENDLRRQLALYGIYEDEVIIGKVTA
jgi:hypothetical protein